jgi:hypothetical protein
MLYTFGSKDLPTCIVHGDGSKTVFDWDSHSDSSANDVEYIAAFNPSVALALLTELEQARSALKTIANDVSVPEHRVHWQALAESYRKLAAEAIARIEGGRDEQR